MICLKIPSGILIRRVQSTEGRCKITLPRWPLPVLLSAMHTNQSSYSFKLTKVMVSCIEAKEEALAAGKRHRTLMRLWSHVPQPCVGFSLHGLNAMLTQHNLALNDTKHEQNYMCHLIRVYKMIQDISFSMVNKMVTIQLLSLNGTELSIEFTEFRKSDKIIMIQKPFLLPVTLWVRRWAAAQELLG